MRGVFRGVFVTSIGLGIGFFVGCSDDRLGSGATGAGGGSSGLTSSGSGGGSSDVSSSGSTGGGGGAGGGAGGGGSGVVCPVELRFTPPPGAANPRVAGEWQGFDLPTATALAGPDASGAFSATLALPPGLHAYKIVYDDAGGSPTWVLDPGAGRRKYVGGVENSALKVRDCERPALEVVTSAAARPAAGQGTFEATLSFRDGLAASGADPSGFVASLDEAGPLAPPAFTVASDGAVTLALTGLADGKHRVTVTAKSQDGRVSDPLRLAFWVEAEAFSWSDAVIYMIVTDRYRDGDAANDPGPTAGADARGDWLGGDLEGVRQSIADGELDALGVRALWLTPFQTGPTSAFPASDGVHQVTGYHGYWPVRAREVEPRIGGADALKALVAEAHAHGIRVLQDFVVNHVHEEHEYVAAHPEWFRTGCVCGTDGCDWTSHALDCMFASYMPDVDHTVPEANAAFVDDAVWWLDTFDLDGLRVDAVKHVEEIATRNLAAEVRETFEAAGTRYFLMGETAMGWNDCADPCNDENYGTIAKYIGPHGLDGQFDFVLYHGVSYKTFAYSDKGMLHADYWVQHGLSKWPAGAIMTPYIGSHDTARFASLADYRGQDAAHDRSVPGHQWDDTAVAPGDGEPYARTRVALAWLLGLPGAPLLYYGDEYGQWGGADPNNRMAWRSGAALGADELATLAFVQKMGAARRDVPALRRGAYVPLAATEDTLLFGRKIAGGSAAIVGVSRATTPQVVSASVSAPLGIGALTTLHDELGGPDVTIGLNGSISVTLPAQGAVVLAP
jgi:glycosidase